MRKKNILFMTLVITVLLIVSTFSGTAISPSTSVSTNSLEVQKKVYDPDKCIWVDSINADTGDTIQFKITVTYYNITEPAHAHHAQAIVVKDYLPTCFEYKTGSAKPFEPVVDPATNKLTWSFTEFLYHGQSLEVTFNATVGSCCGEQINRANATAYEYCTGKTISGQASVTINVECPNPKIDVEKKVWDGICDWKDVIYAKYGETVKFNITVHNNGDVKLINVIVNDTLPDSLEYADNAKVNGVPDEPDISPDGKNLVWVFNTLEINEKIYIEFNARVIGEPCSEDINWVDVRGITVNQKVANDRDSATVKIEGMCIEKQVWDEEKDEWRDDTTVSQGKEVRFRITVYYYGDYKLYNIKIRDELPDCLDYANDATVNGAPKEPEVAGKKIWWNLSTEYDLYDGDHLTIEFNAIATEYNCEEPAVNWVYITADECSGQILNGKDDATVYVICGLNADAGGPYSGEINDDIEITGLASGGKPPYTYKWDMDKDGEYDDATGAEVTWSWSSPGVYNIWLKVTDDDSKTDEDYATVTVTSQSNHPPNKPTIYGPSSGLQTNTKYNYDITSNDTDGDKIYYYIDWGDGATEEWIGPYNPGVTIKRNHSWASASTSYNIRVKAKDGYNAESEWGSLTIKTPKTKPYNLPLLMKLLERFPIFERLIIILQQLKTK